MYECMKLLGNNIIDGRMENDSFGPNLLLGCLHIRIQDGIRSKCSSMQMYISMDVPLEQHASYVITENAVVLK